MRARSRDTRLSPPSYFKSTGHSGGSTTVTTIGPKYAGLSGGMSQETLDVVTPMYAARRKRGEIILNPFASTKKYPRTTISGPELHVQYVDPPADPSWADYECIDEWILTTPLQDGVVGSPNPFTAEEILSLAEIVGTSTYAKMQKSVVELQTSLIDIKRTIELLLHPVRNAQIFLKKVKSAKDLDAASQALTLAEYLAKEWLTYRYGWSQLYRDMRDVIKALKKDERASGLQKAFAKQKQSRTWTETFSHKFNSTWGTVYFERVTTQDVTVRGGIFYEAALGVRTYLGLTALDVPATLWDIIPYSFVVDWVVGVQDYLRAVLRQLALPVLGSYYTVEVVTTVVTVPVGFTPAPDSPGVYSCTVTKDCVGSRLEVTIEKSRVVPLPTPSLNLNFQIQNLVDLRVADGLALLVNLLHRR